jgi:SH3 domain-containing protein
MSDEPTTPTAARGAFLWIGAVILVIMAATVTAFIAVVLLGSDGAPPTSEDPAATPTVAVSVRDLALRSAPDGATAIVARITTGDPVSILGRNASGDWLLVAPEADPSTEGWVPADGIDPLPPLDQVPVATVVSAPGTETATATATGAPTFTPDLPDLTIEAVFARNNRLTVVIANIGVVDATGAIFISVDGGAPIPADVKPGEPLRPDDRLEAVLDTEYVQRRATVRVTVSTNPAIDEETLENNAFETVVTPDRANDLSITIISLDGPEGSLRVTIRNESSIPITGQATVSARESSGDFTQLGTQQPFFTLAPGETLDIDFPPVDPELELALDNIEVLMSTTAINDADSTNDIYPRR